MDMTAVAIVAIIVWGIVSLADAKKSKKAQKFAQNDNAELEQKLAAMQERIEVLEKIVTDENYDLKRQFADLEKDKVA